MLVFKYICAVIALLSTLLFISNLISDITMPSIVRANEMNVPEDKVILHSASLRLILIIIMSLTWPVLFIF